VLYFDNLSPDSADAYLADGLTEELTARLGQIDRLIVLGRTTVRRYRGTGGRSLGTAYLLTGSVRRSADRLRVTVELVRTATGVRVWGEQYNRSSTDLLAVEEDIARQVAVTVAGRLLPQERGALAAPMTRNQEAYDLFLRGNYYFAQRTAQSVARAIEYYERAAGLDARFTEPLAQAALACGVSLSWGWPHPGPSTDSVLARGVVLADRALQQDSASAEAWLALGYLLMFRYPRTFDGVRQALQRALALNPQSAEAYHQYGYVLALLGDDSGAISAHHQALRIEPDRYHTLYQLGLIHGIGRRFLEARAWYDSALVVNPGYLYAFNNRARIRLALGDTAGARRDAEALLRVGAEDMRLRGQITLALFEAASGDTAAARMRVPAALRLLADSMRPSPNEATRVAPVFIATGEPERALRLLEHVSPRGMHLWWLLQSWEFDPLRGNPRFQRLVEESRPR
jgi:serine/threonine-protein kinase